MNNHLLDFLKWWLAEATSENPPLQVKQHGLCDSSALWEEHNNVDAVLKNELVRAFEEDGLDDMYPFGGSHTYVVDGQRLTQHLNPKRLAWVRKKIAELEAQVDPDPAA